MAGSAAIPVDAELHWQEMNALLSSVPLPAGPEEDHADANRNDENLLHNGDPGMRRENCSGEIRV